MKKVLHSLLAISLVLGLATTSFGQIHLDGDSLDWADYPVLISAPDNQDGMFPPEVGAVVSDRVDIKTIKATVIGNTLFGYMEFWGGPVWPNDAYENDREGTIMYSSRGYYHLLLDIDNDPMTGWSTDWYEAHYTPLGYLISQGVEAAPIGAEVMQECFYRTRDDYEVANGANKYDNLGQWAADYEEYDGQTDNGSDYEIFDMPVPDIDSSAMWAWSGSVNVASTDQEGLYDSLLSYWAGQAWGHSFLEFGVELTPIQKYYMLKDGRTVLQPGQVMGICGMTETPIDDWGVDMTTRGEVTLPDEMAMRPSEIDFDGNEDDWADLPVLISAPDNQDGMFPPEVGAVVTDIVDIKEIKGFITDGNLYFQMKFWGGPAWPNNAYENDREGTIMYSSRGYYHLLMDIDNDPMTGWSTDWYEAHYTPLGYLISQGVEASPIGAEVMQENFFRTRDDYEVANGANKYDNLGQWGADYEEYDGQTDNGSDYEIYNYDIAAPDSVRMLRFDGLEVNNSSDGDILDGNTEWQGHAWGYDFIETGISLDAIKKYYAAKDGRSVLNSGDVVGICGMTETPVDDWGVDMTTRGEITVDVATDVAEKGTGIVEQFSLSNNYPNPFNPSTKIQYSIPTNEFVSLKVYDVIGREVATLVNQQQSAGVYDVKFNASNLTSGIYFYRIDAGSFAEVKKMMLIK